MISAIVFLVLLSGGFFVNLAKHGESKGEFHVGWSLVNVGVTLWLLYNAGFFNVFNK